MADFENMDTDTSDFEITAQSGVTITMGYSLIDLNIPADNTTDGYNVTAADMDFVEPAGGFEVDCTGLINDPTFQTYCEITSTYGQFQWIVVDIPQTTEI